MLFGGTGPQTYGVPGRFQAPLRAPEVPRAAFPKPGERGLKSKLPTCSQTITNGAVVGASWAVLEGLGARPRSKYP